MAKNYNLETGGTKGGGGLADVRGLIADLIRLGKLGEGGEQQAPPSAAPVGEPTAGGGVKTAGGQGVKVSEVLRSDKPSTVGQMAGRERAVGRPMPGRRTADISGPQRTAGAGVGTTGGPPIASATGAQGIGEGGPPIASGMSDQQVQQPPTTPAPDTGGDGGSNWGQYLGTVSPILGVVGTIYDEVWGDDETEGQKAARRATEQQTSLRRKFDAAYENYFLPLQVGTKIHAYQQMTRNTENFDYANEALKGFIEGNAGIWSGSGGWNNVFNYIDSTVDFSEIEANYEESPDPTATGVLSVILGNAGLYPGINIALALVLSKWGNALTKTANNRQKDQPRW